MMKGVGNYLIDYYSSSLDKWCFKIGKTTDGEKRIKQYKTGNFTQEFFAWFPCDLNHETSREEKLINFCKKFFKSPAEYREHFLLPGTPEEALRLLEENGLYEKVFKLTGKKSVNYIKRTQTFDSQVIETDVRTKRPSCGFFPGHHAQVIGKAGPDEEYRTMLVYCDMSPSGKITDLEEPKRDFVSKKFHNSQRFAKRNAQSEINYKERTKNNALNNGLSTIIDKELAIKPGDVFVANEYCGLIKMKKDEIIGRLMEINEFRT